MRAAGVMETKPGHIGTKAHFEKAIRYFLNWKIKIHAINKPLRAKNRRFVSPTLTDQIRRELGWRSDYYE